MSHSSSPSSERYFDSRFWDFTKKARPTCEVKRGFIQNPGLLLAIFVALTAGLCMLLGVSTSSWWGRLAVGPASSMTSMGWFSTFPARFASFLRTELVCRSFLMRGMTPLTAGFARLFGSKLMRCTLLMRRMAPFAARFTRLFGSELMRGSFFMRSVTALAGYLALFILVHWGKPTLAGPTAFAIAASTTITIFIMGSMIVVTSMWPVTSMLAFMTAASVIAISISIWSHDNSPNLDTE
jgi:hypothetical protein